jgi:hypothetical protein
MENHVSSSLGVGQPRQHTLSGLSLRLALVLLLLVPILAQAQSCALCYTQAASSGSRMMRALRSGILILVIPPTLMSLGVIFVAYVKRNQFRRTDSAGPGLQTDLDESPEAAPDYRINHLDQRSEIASANDNCSAQSAP